MKKKLSDHDARCIAKQCGMDDRLRRFWGDYVRGCGGSVTAKPRMSVIAAWFGVSERHARRIMAEFRRLGAVLSKPQFRPSPVGPRQMSNVYTVLVMPVAQVMARVSEAAKRSIAGLLATAAAPLVPASAVPSVAVGGWKADMGVRLEAKTEISESEDAEIRMRLARRAQERGELEARWRRRS